MVAGMGQGRTWDYQKENGYLLVAIAKTHNGAALRHEDIARLFRTSGEQKDRDKRLRKDTLKINDSGMPDQAYWNSLFDIPLIVDWLNLTVVDAPIVEIGCGYGTFTVPIARATNAEVYAFDIDPSMIETAERNITQSGVRNVRFYVRDAIEEGTGLLPDCAGMVLLFNILHFGGRGVLLEEASRIIKPNGVVAILHWRKDIETPRGPSVHLRPDQQMILDSIRGLDLSLKGNGIILKPYHWGIQLTKRAKQ
jgi:SAM-dependent methyltransferase